MFCKMLLPRLLLAVCCCFGWASTSNILMITMGGTKSHKVPFWALAKALTLRGHYVTFVNGFEADFHMDGLVEVTPTRLVQFIENYTNWDLVGERYAGRAPLSLPAAIRYPIEACNSLLSDPATRRLLSTASGNSSDSGSHKGSQQSSAYDLAIVDGAFPECALGIVHRLNVTAFIYINTVAFYTGSVSLAGNPVAYAVTPHVFTSWTQRMDFLQRVGNCVTHVFANMLHWYCMRGVHCVLRQHLGAMPHPYTLGRDVAFILQNGHATLTYPRAYLPNVVEVACLHCRPPAANLSRLIDANLAQFLAAAPEGIVFMSMGTSVRSSRLPPELLQLFVTVFTRLPRHHVIWTWAGNATRLLTALPSNVRVRPWLPQQDILGQRQLKLFITHGGLLSLHEAVYHGVPLLVLPVFCDHDVNAAKAVQDGYARRLELAQLSEEALYTAIYDVLHNDGYRRAVRRQRSLLLDQLVQPLRMAIHWTEYVIRHRGAGHFQSPDRHMNYFTRQSLDVLGFLLLLLLAMLLLLRSLCKCCRQRHKTKTA